jgi:hypothetical protein
MVSFDRREFLKSAGITLVATQAPSDALLRWDRGSTKA